MRAKGAWEVRAGIVPGTPEPEFTRQWWYTEADLEADRATPQDRPTVFVKQRDAAYEYARCITDPVRFNWVELTWIWY